MSMNAKFIGRLGKRKLEFETYQTPTDVSYKLKASRSPIQEYKDWVRSFLTAEDSAEHFADLDAFAQEVIALGIRVEVEVS